MVGKNVYFLNLLFIWILNEFCFSSIVRANFIFVATEKISITSCEGSTKYGIFFFVDFKNISRPCTCTVIPWFTGQLLVTSWGKISYTCNTQVYVNRSLIYDCQQNEEISSQTLNVEMNNSFLVQSEYLTSASATFEHCLGFQEKGNV